jgi:glycosyltransferase involved in cell wall biosynthesis
MQCLYVARQQAHLSVEEHAMTPKVSVIIPTHNRASLLGRAVNSVLSQTFIDFELIIVDDASNDQTDLVVKSFADRRIKYIHHEVNGGEAESRNTGIRNAQGEYIAYLDDDDEWLPRKLEKQVRVMDGCGPDTGVIYTGMYHIELNTGKKVYSEEACRRGHILEQLLENNFVTGSTALVRSECYRKVGMYDPTVRFGPDWEMWIRIAKYFEFESIPEPLYCYSIHRNRLSANFAIQIEGLRRILELHSNLFLKNSKAHSRQLTNLGLLYYLCGNPTQARMFLKRGLCRYPMWARPYRLFFLSFLPRNSFLKLLALQERASTN